MGTLDGRSAVVTGAGGGIGRATSIELARAGAGLTIVDRDEAALQEKGARSRPRAPRSSAKSRTCPFPLMSSATSARRSRVSDA